MQNASNWSDRFSGNYRYRSQQNLKRRQRRSTREEQAFRLLEAESKAALIRIKAQMPPSDAWCERAIWRLICKQAALGDPDAKLVLRFHDQKCRREQRSADSVRLKRLVRARRFQCRDLRSDECAILQLLVASTPRTARLRTGDDKALSHIVGSKLLALDDAYVQTNPIMRRTLRVDVDTVFEGGFAALAAEIKKLHVPMPNIVVGSVDQHGCLLKPHLIWLLGDPVPFTRKGRAAPRHMFEATLEALTAALLPIGADPGGLSNTLRTKNPVSEQWDYAVLAEMPYCLKRDPTGRAPEYPELGARLDLKSTKAILNRIRSSPSGCIAADHPNPHIARQSNAVFHAIRPTAYARVGWFRDEGHGSQEDFTQELIAKAFEVGARGGERAAESVARKVALWTWRNYRQVPRSTITPEERRTRQIAGQAKGAASKRARTLSELIEAAAEIVSEDRRVTQAAVAERAGRSEGTVRAHWAAVLTAIGQGTSPEPTVQSSVDKKRPRGSRVSVPLPAETASYAPARPSANALVGVSQAQSGRTAGPVEVPVDELGALARRVVAGATGGDAALVRMRDACGLSALRDGAGAVPRGNPPGAGCRIIRRGREGAALAITSRDRVLVPPDNSQGTDRGFRTPSPRSSTRLHR